MITKGQHYDAPTMSCRFTVTRVAKDGSWADLAVRSYTRCRWTKRQPLSDGVFPFTVVLLMDGAK